MAAKERQQRSRQGGDAALAIDRSDVGRRGRRTRFDIAHTVKPSGIGLSKSLGHSHEIVDIGRAGEPLLGEPSENSGKGRPRGHPGRSLKHYAAVGDFE